MGDEDLVVHVGMLHDMINEREGKGFGWLVVALIIRLSVYSVRYLAVKWRKDFEMT